MAIKTCFVLPSLAAGGAERVISFLANTLQGKEFETYLIIVGFENKSFYSVPNSTVIFLNKKRVLTAIPSLVKSFIEIKPKIIFSSIGHLNLVMGFLSIFFNKTIFIGRESSVISERKKYSSNKKSMPRFIVRFLYNQLDYIVCQSMDMMLDFRNIYKLSTRKIGVINNPMRIPPKLKKSASHSDILRCITIGRLEQVKGHMRILKSLSRVKRPFVYTIIGDGVLREKLLSYAKSNHICDKVNFVGHRQNIYDYLVLNDIYLQGSYVEGFPNTLLEACSVGLPALCFNAPGGTKEIISNLNGKIVAEEKEFTSFLNHFEHSQWDIEKIKKQMETKFGEEKIKKQYKELFFTLLKQRV